MSQTSVAVLLIALLVSGGLWLTVRVERHSSLEVLPGYCRRRVLWWQAHAGAVYLLCALVAIAVFGLELVALVR